jgi:Lantibiotic dehydratase, N terminus
MESHSPFIVRVAGRPAETLDELASGSLAGLLAQGRKLEERLRRVRGEMVDRLFAAVHESSPECRRFLLQVKRDCFNAKPLARHLSSPLWPELQRVCGGLERSLLALEEELAGWEGHLERVFRAERNGQRHRLLEQIQEPSLLRGLALASPELVTALDRLRRQPPDAWGRKERSLETSLLRYVSRVAVKLSPYSTFTRLALGAVRRDLPPGGAEFVGADWQPRSLLRLKRYLLDQINEMLLRYAPVRRTLRVNLNDTVEEAGPGRYRYLRLGYWDLHAESGELRYFFDAFVHLNLEPARLATLQSLLPPGGLPYEELVAALAAGGEEDAAGFVERLLRVGFLHLVLPWPSNEGHLEKRMLSFLRQGPGWEGDVELARLRALLERMVALEEGYPTAPAPAASLEEIDRIIDETWDVAARLADLPPTAVRRRSKKGGYYEDVFLTPGPGSGSQAVLEIPETTARQLLKSIDPLVRLAYLHNHRHDFMHSLAAFMLQRWPDGREVGLLELFAAAQPLWKQSRQYKVDTRPPAGLHTSFNPFGLECIERLRALREEIWSQVDRWLAAGPDENRIVGGELAALLAAAPSCYAPPVGPCLFVQMADREGRLWALNRIYEGTGRFASRFTPVMDEESRRFYTGHYTARSGFRVGERRGEFIDIMRPQGDTLNVHAVQTARVLEAPGEPTHLPGSRRLSLRDLAVRVERESLLPVLVDASGCELQLLHLGGAGPMFMPPLVKFLSLFGPGEILPVFPPRPGVPAGDCTVRQRLTIDNIVLQRKRWIFYSDAVPAEFTELPEEKAFAAINRWRLEHGLPERMFLLEATPHFVLADRYKPQYVDFTSPLFVSLFRSALKAGSGPLVLEEPLPSPEALPRDARGRRWAVELQLDSFTLRPEDGREDVAVPGFHPVSTLEGDFIHTEPVGLMT